MASTTIPGFGGTVIRPCEAGYDAARAIWNAMHDRLPALIARPRSAPDVAAAIRHARAEGLLIAVRGGGHSMPGHSVCDDGIVIDLRELNQVRVDPRAQTAIIGGGTLLGEVDRATQEHGLVLPAWRCLAHRRGRPHARRRRRPPDAPLRPDHRQPAVRAGRHRRRRDPAGVSGRAHRTVLGVARRRRQLRHRHRVRVRAARAVGARHPGHLPPARGGAPGDRARPARWRTPRPATNCCGRASCGAPATCRG